MWKKEASHRGYYVPGQKSGINTIPRNAPKSMHQDGIPKGHPKVAATQSGEIKQKWKRRGDM